MSEQRLALASTSGFYSERIDHLRFFAAPLVMWWHFQALPQLGQIIPQVPDFWLLSLFGEGHIGVGLFFTLSGYLFYYISWERKIDYKQFLINRVLRIAPLLIFWTLLLVFLDPTLNIPAIVVTLLTTFGNLPGVGWSVIIEVQFYLLFPLLLMFTRKYGLKYLAGLLGIIVAVRTIVWFASAGAIVPIAYASIFGRLDQFLLGMIAAHSVLTARSFPTRYWLFLIAGVLIIVLSTRYLDDHGGLKESFAARMWIWLPFAQGLGWALLIAGYVKLPVALNIPLLARLGEWSYSLYWSHQTILLAIGYGLISKKIVTIDSPISAVLLFSLIGVPIACAFSALSFYVIEKPFIEMRRSYSR